MKAQRAQTSDTAFVHFLFISEDFISQPLTCSVVKVKWELRSSARYLKCELLVNREHNPTVHMYMVNVLGTWFLRKHLHLKLSFRTARKCQHCHHNRVRECSSTWSFYIFIKNISIRIELATREYSGEINKNTSLRRRLFWKVVWRTFCYEKNGSKWAERLGELATEI